MTDTAAKPSYSTDPALYIYTSLTAGSSHIVTATSRLETILRANRVPFKALDIATDEKARMLWGRRAGKDEGGRMRKLPALVQMGLVLGDLVEIEDWNEYGELKQHVTIYHDDFTIPPKNQAPIPNPLRPLQHSKPAASAAAPTSTTTPKAAPAAPPLPGKKENEPKATEEPTRSGVASAVASAAAPIKSIAEEAAQKAKQVRLNSLREKVYGKEDKDSSTEGESKDTAKEGGSRDTDTAATAADGVKTSDEDTAAAIPAPLNLTKQSPVASAVGTSDLTISPPTPTVKAAGAAGLQSPTTGAWKTTTQEDHLRQVLQSPTSGTWKAGDSNMALPIRGHHGSTIPSASVDEIAAVETAETIPEASAEEEEDEEDDEAEKK
ncbi:hypothetical protein BJ170DRAFT_15389 [Xylariales sp. AK1849]|nr:hypothetical protein BJ170DRAFT_15389 [Xylariales sp. AK1849]